MKKYSGFTLAEVLITLAVVGIVAAMTLPTLIQKYQEKATITALKKFYSHINQAYILNLAKNPDDYTDDNILAGLKIIKKCEKGDVSCITQTYKYLNGTNAEYFGKNDKYSNRYYTAQLADGMLIRYVNQNQTSPSSTLTDIVGEFAVDINGDKKPNILGRDVFYFYITKKGIVPFGVPEITGENGFNGYCKARNSSNLGYGYGCTAWVLYNENLDYLHCPGELSWSGKIKCK